MSNINEWLEENSRILSGEITEINRRELGNKSISGSGTKVIVNEIIKNLEACLCPKK